jgi:hypothetical protein
VDALVVSARGIRVRSRVAGLRAALVRAARSPRLDPCGDGPAWERPAGWTLAAAAALFTLAAIGRELLLDVPDLNDSAFHLALALRARAALAAGASPFDFWFAEVGMGFPVFHHYQHLPHLALVALDALLGGRVPLSTLYRGMLGALLVGFPLAIHLACRRVGLAPLVAAGAALAAPLVSTPYLYGVGWESYLWRGSGLFTQAFAQLLFPLAVAESLRAVRLRSGLRRSAVLLGATFLAQLVYGYMAALSAAAALLARAGRRRHAARLLALAAGVLAITAYFVVPAARDARFANHSVWELAEKWDSLGAARVLRALATGALLDQGRWPVLTLLLALGVGFAMLRGGTLLRALLVLFVGWLALYFGRTTWGALVDLLPFARDIPLHRFVGGVHLFALPLVGIGLWLLARLVGAGGSWPRSLAALALALLVLAPALRERWAYAAQGLVWKREAGVAIARDRDTADLLAALSRLPRTGRVYVGLPGRPAEYLRTAAVPLSALCLVRGIDTLGFLFHSMSFPGDTQVYFAPDDEAALRTWAVRWVVLPTSMPAAPFLRPRATFGRFRLYEYPYAGYFGIGTAPLALPWSKPTAFEIADAWRRSPLPARDVYPLLALDGDRDARREAPAALAYRDRRELDAVLLAATASSTPATRLVLTESPWQALVRTDAASIVVLRATYHPGLTASVDGKPARVRAVAPFFAAVALGAGDHDVRLAYAPARHWPWWLLGALVLLFLPRLARAAEKIAARLPPVRVPPLPPRAREPLAAFAMALVAGLPLLHGKELAGHDAVQYLTQLSELHRVLGDGALPPVWAPDLAAGAGAPFFGFYPPLLLVLAESLHAVGLGLVWSIDLATLGLFVAAVVLTCLYARDAWGNGAGVVAAAAFAFAPYVLLDLYVRHAFLEASALVGMPLAAWGVLRGRPLGVAAGSALLLLGHPALAPFLFPGLLLYAWSCGTALRSALGMLYGLALSAWSVVPAAIERGALKLDTVIHGGPLDYRNHFVYVDQLLWSPWGFGLSVPGHGDGMSFRIGPFHLAAMALGVWAWRRRRTTWALAAMGLLAAALATTFAAPLWNALPLLQAVQFPWRALAVTAFATAVLAGAGLRRHPRVAVALFVLGGLPLAAPQRYLEVDERDYRPERIARDALQPGTLGIFEPRAAPVLPYDPAPAHVLRGDARVVSVEQHSDAETLWLVAASPGLLLVTLNVFPGWTAEVEGRPQPIVALGGRIAVAFPAGATSIALRWRPSALRRACGVVSLLALAALPVPWIDARRRRGKLAPAVD